MSTPQETYRNAANSDTARKARDTAQSIGNEASEFAANVSDMAGRHFDRAQDVAADAYDRAHSAARSNPLAAVAIALGVGFLFGALATRR